MAPPARSKAAPSKPAKKATPAAKKVASKATPAAKKVAKKVAPAAKKVAPAAKKIAPKAAAPKPAPESPKKVAKGIEYAKKIAKIEAAAEKAGVELPKGASEKALAAAEAKLGVKLPAEVRAFYLAHDGGPDGEAVCGNRQLLSLEGMVRQWEMYKEAFDEGEFDEEDAEPDEGVQRAWWIPAWIPVSYDLGGNHDVVDLEPDDGGRVGQIVAVWHDDSARSVEGESFLGWLEEQEWGQEE